jgi:CCR4-NOT transcription complex subunit 4
VVNLNKAYNPFGRNGPSYSAYVTYQKEEEAALAILAIDNLEIDGHVIKASFGTTKYCNFFLRNDECYNKECLYLHSFAQDSEIIANKVRLNKKTVFLIILYFI